MPDVGMSWATEFKIDATYTLVSDTDVAISTSSPTLVSAPPCTPPACNQLGCPKHFYAAAEAQKCTQLFAIKVPVFGTVVLSAKLGTSDGSPDDDSDNSDDQDDSFSGDTVTGGLYWSLGEGAKCEGEGAHTVPGIGGDTPLECDVCYSISIPGTSALSGTFGVRCPFDGLGLCNVVRPANPTALYAVLAFHSRKSKYTPVSVRHTQIGIELGMPCYIAILVLLVLVVAWDILWGLNPKGACTRCHKRTSPACTNQCSLYYQCHVCWCPTHALVHAAQNVSSGVILGHAPHQTIVTPLLPQPAVLQSPAVPPRESIMQAPVHVPASIPERASVESLSASSVTPPEASVAYTVVYNSVIRSGLSSKSAKVGEAAVGEELFATKFETNSSGLERIKCDRGWLSIRAADGTLLLQKSEALTQAQQQAILKEQLISFHQRRLLALGTSHTQISIELVALDEKLARLAAAFFERQEDLNNQLGKQ